MELFTRSGKLFTGTVGSDDNGKAVYTVDVKCDRCHVVNGQRVWLMGMENGRPYSYTGFDCWTCGNTGVRGTRQERLFTEAELSRVNKTAATRAAKKAEADRIAAERVEAARAEKEYAFRSGNADFLARLATLDGEFWAKFKESFLSRAMAPTARQVEVVDAEIAKRVANACSAFIGAIGDKVTLTIKIERIISLQSQFGANYITIGRTADGSVVTYKGLINIGMIGETSTVKATIKEHSSYNGVNQTAIQRPKLV